MRQTPILFALSYYGEKPIAGPGNNATIQQILEAAGLPKNSADEIPWCSAFLVWCFQQCCIETSANAAALSWQGYSTETDQPKLGDIVVLEWHDQQGAHHHVGFFVRETLDGIYILAGNQNNEVDIALWKKIDVLSYRHYVGP